MGIDIEGYGFDGPFANISDLKNQSGVYVILGKEGNAAWDIVDVGESSELRDRVKDHDRRPCWEEQGFRTLAYAAYYVGENQRMEIESKIRDKYNPPCGER